MKTFLFLFLMVFSFSFMGGINEVKAQCPSGTGWVQQVPLTFNYTYPDNSQCKVIIHWCKRDPGLNPYGATCEVYIGEIFIKLDCYNGNYPIDINQIYEKLINSGELAACFGPNIPLCPLQSQSTVFLSNGGCYYYTEEWILEEDGLAHGYIVAHPCDPDTPHYCRTFYTICKELVNGKWVYHLQNGDPAPAFQCSEGCNSICE